MARDTQTGVFDSCLAALPLQKQKTEQIPTDVHLVVGNVSKQSANRSEFWDVEARCDRVSDSVGRAWA